LYSDNANANANANANSNSKGVLNLKHSVKKVKSYDTTMHNANASAQSYDSFVSLKRKSSDRPPEYQNTLQSIALDQNKLKMQTEKSLTL
jgi:hypothetical protein